VLELICYFVAVVLFVLAAFRMTTKRAELGWLGLAFFALPLLIQAMQAVG
jgi:hypothetical protein